ncbi:hypothetical protein HMN09_00799500 [Mycena chlorophos]|uniref:GED domain-containing protein n=1 Tax=Mycena chlorophos TaxID=658473 RepID=A0A8H6SUG2_MYCCL|nr:hypothetical protein HMN09_00799500 [Mycena chlorophos]
MSATNVPSSGAQVFAITELCFLICDPRHFGDLNTRTLYNLALVSRTISDVALDALWRDIRGVDRLARLLPRDACGIFVGTRPDDEVPHIPRPDEYRAWHYRLKRPLTEADLTAFDKYASRIRVLSLGPLSWASNAVYERGGELLFDIKQLRNPVLPRLKALYWTPDTNDGSFGGYFLLNGPLEIFNLSPRSKIFPLPSTAAPLQETAMVRAKRAFTQPLLSWLPNVSEINISAGPHLPALSGEGGERLTNLQRLYCDLDVERPFVRDLSRLPHLRHIALRHVSAGPFGLSRGGFPSLESFDIATTPSTMTELLRSVSSANLQSVHYTLRHGQTWDRPQTFWDALLPNHLPSRLVTLTSFALSVYSLAMSSVAPLYACRALQELEISALNIACTDADIQQMADAWPSLKRLVLGVGLYTPMSAHVPRLYGLWPLATNCPNLEMLELQLNAGVDGPFDPARAGGQIPPRQDESRQPLQFNPIRSPCGDPTRVATFLQVAFPRLSRDSLGPRAGPLNGSWSAVGERLALAAHFIDYIPLTIKHEFNRRLVESLHDALVLQFVEGENIEERMKELLAEDPQISERRSALEGRLEKLRETQMRLDAL